MAKNTLPPGLDSPSRFLIGRTSKFQPETKVGPSYYTRMRQTRNIKAFQEGFLYSFDSQVYPTILPKDTPVSILDKLILTEFEAPILTEIGDYLLIEP